MRIVQLIDSLDAGGAERMAVNLANSLELKIEFSGIIATRNEGLLLEFIDNKKNYLFLNKKTTLDFKALLKLKNYCISNEIDIIHAHTTSFFSAFLLKIILFKIKIIYHEHTGFRSFENIFQNKLLWICSFLFHGIITVNNDLLDWCKNKLNCRKVIYLTNFVSNKQLVGTTNLVGIAGSRILCLANLKKPKNHLLLLKAAINIIDKNPKWTFHLVGKDFNDEYSKELKDFIIKNNLANNVFIYGQRKDTISIINQSDICVIPSDFEGLPMAFLEFGLCSKPVMSTKVGEIALIIENNKNGILVPVNNDHLFAIAINELIENTNLRIKFGQNLNSKINQCFSENTIIEKYLEWLKNK